jgi:hypothetical protein
MTKTPDIRHIAFLVAAGLITFLPARQSLAQGANQPYNFLANVTCNLNIYLGTGCMATSVAIPAQKRLVIERVAASIIPDNPGGSSYELYVYTSPSPATLVPVAFINAVPPGTGYFSHTQEIVGFADGGSTVTILLTSDANLSSFTALLSVAGTLIDCSPSCAPITQVH